MATKAETIYHHTCDLWGQERGDGELAHLWGPNIEQIPFGGEHWREAADAYLRFGKGRHKARLNFGDCLTYAVARLANEPLLFTGDDFPHTDLALA